MASVLEKMRDDLLAIASGLEGDVDPVVQTVGGLEDELVEAAVVGYPAEPLAGEVLVGMGLPAWPHLLGQPYVDGLAGHVLTCGGASNGSVEHGASIAGGDRDRLPYVSTKWLKHLLTEAAEVGYLLA